MEARTTSLLRIALLLLSSLGLAGVQTAVASDAHAGKLRFEENKNQCSPVVCFKTDLLHNEKLFLEKNAFTYLFVNGDDLEQLHHHWLGAKGGNANGTVHYHAFKASFVNSNPLVDIQASDAFPEYRNYFLGNDPGKWAPGVKLYANLDYKALYPGIDMHLHSSDYNLIYDFVVQPGASPASIQINYTGASSVYLSGGMLHLETTLGTVTEQQPFAYQLVNGKKKKVNCRYVLHGTTLGFEFPSGYDQQQPLIIDPTLICSTFTGSIADNWGYTATYDAQGNIYSSGIASGPGYPLTVGAFQNTFGGGGSGGNQYPFDISITKYNPTGTALIYSTYLGGSDNEQPQSIVVDAAGDLVLMGRSYSSDFPVTATAFQKVKSGGADIVVTKFNPAGTILLGSTYIGGKGEDGVNITADWGIWTSLKYNYGDDGRSDIATDNSGNCYIASSTQSSNFPITPGAYQTAFAGGTQDGCVFKLDNTLSHLLWSTYLGGNGDDACYGLALSAGNSVYVTGGTASTNFPTTAGALHTSYLGGPCDGFVAHLDNTGASLQQSTFVGTTGYDQSFFVQLDRNDNVYLYGQTGAGYLVTPGTYSNPNSGQFIHKLNPGLSATVYSTVFGTGKGMPDISPSAFLVDTCENVYTSGWGGACIPVGQNGNTTGLPVTGNAFQQTTDGCDFYFFVLKKNATSLWYATFFGGPGGTDEHVDGGTSRFDKDGVIYQAVCAGCGGNPGFPTTPGAWSTTNNSSNCNNAVVKMAFELVNLHAVAKVAPSDTICAEGTIQFVNNSIGAHNYLWNFGDGSAKDTATAPAHTYSTPGTFTVSLLALDSASCKIADSAHLVVHVLPLPVVNLGTDTTACGAFNLLLNAGNPGAQYLWSTGNTSQTLQITSVGSYWVKVSYGKCAAYDTLLVRALAKPDIGHDTSVCQGTTLLLNAGDPGCIYNWNTGAHTQTITVTTSGNYWVTVQGGCSVQSDTLKVSVVVPPIVALGPDTVLCPNSSLVLDAGNPGSTYLWSTGATTPDLTVTHAGTYWVKVSTKGCARSDSISVGKINPHMLGAGQSLCTVPEPVMLDAGKVPGASYLWSTGDTTQTIAISQPGVYSVSVVTPACRIKDSVEFTGELFGSSFYIPDAFSPNGDGRNDVFRAQGADILTFDMKIFDRWGELLFESTALDKGWDGTRNGSPVSNDVYVYVVEYTDACDGRHKQRAVGHVMVYR